jgi:hypothetical protein
MVDDINNLFVDNKIQGAFSGDALSTLQNWDFWV